MPDRPNSVASLLHARRIAQPDGAAILAPDRRPLTFAGLEQHVTAVAQQLRTLGIGRNDRVAIILPNGPEMAAAFLAVASCATAAPLNPNYRTAEYQFYLADLEARALVILAELDSPARAVAHRLGIPIVELTPQGTTAGLFALHGAAAGRAVTDRSATTDDVALVLHTSGTTSRPKIVPLTQRNILTSAGNIRTTLQLTDADRCLNVMVLFHIHGLMAALLASLSAGAGVVCTPGYLAPRFYGWLDQFQPTWYTAVPTIHQSILARAAANRAIIARSRLRFIRSSSASLPPSVMADLEQTFGAPVVEAYGMTEASHQMTSNPLPPAERKAGTVGRAAGPQVAIMDETSDRLLPQGEIGEIVICGDNVTAGYANNSEANAKAFAAGWFRTGDQGFFDEDGYLTISGRLKEIINRAGEKVLPREIDEVLLDHPAVRQAVAFAIPNPMLGEEVGAAVIVDDPQITSQQLRRFAAVRLAAFKVPYQLLIVDEIPKGATGKLQRIGLADKLGVTAAEMAGRNLAPFVAPETELEQALAAIWCEVLDLPAVGVDQRFLDSGGDSMLAAELVAAICERFGLRLSIVDLFDAPTIRTQAVVIEQLLAGDDAHAAPRLLRKVRPASEAGPSLYLVPGGGGGEEEFLTYARLIDLLDPALTICGFFARGQDGATPAHETAAAMVADYLDELRRLQPNGPYLLCGECVGGKVAYELACRLEAAGETVALLLLNTRLADIGAGRPPRNYWLGRARFHWEQLQQRSVPERVRYLTDTLKASPLNPAVVRQPEFESERRILRARVTYNELLQRHQPAASLQQPIDLIVSADYHAANPTLGVDSLAAGAVRVHSVAGDYDSYLGEHVNTTAQRLNACLHAARHRLKLN